MKTTTKVEPAAGAVMQPSITEVDGWYIDLPGLSCRESRGLGFGYVAVTLGKRDRGADQTTGHSVPWIHRRRNQPSNRRRSNHDFQS